MLYTYSFAILQLKSHCTSYSKHNLPVNHRYFPKSHKLSTRDPTIEPRNFSVSYQSPALSHNYLNIAIPPPNCLTPHRTCPNPRSISRPQPAIRKRPRVSSWRERRPAEWPPSRHFYAPAPAAHYACALSRGRNLPLAARSPRTRKCTHTRARLQVLPAC